MSDTPLTRDEFLNDVIRVTNQDYEAVRRIKQTDAALRASLERCQDHQAHDTEEIVKLRATVELQNQESNRLLGESIELGAENKRLKEFVSYTYENEKKCGSPLGERAKALLKEWGGVAMNDLIRDSLLTQQEIASLRAQVTRLKTMSTVEMMCENVNVDSHVREWEARCLKAEAQVTAMEQERGFWTSSFEPYQLRITTLEQQLAAMTTERDDLYNKLHVYQTVYGGETEPLAPTGPQHRHTWVDGRCSECGQANRAVEF